MEINEDINPYSEQCNLLKMTSIPTFGQYSDDYTFLEQVLILKSESQPDYLPENMKSKIDNLKKSHQNVNPEYFQILQHCTNIQELITISNDDDNDDSMKI